MLSDISTADDPAGSFVTACSQLTDDNAPLIPSTTPVNPTSQFSFGFDFQDDLKASRPYRNVKRDSVDLSFRTSIARSHAWSVFSGLSLGDISNVSVIALPIYADEITNSCHYRFGSQPLEQPCAAPGPITSGDTFLRDCLEAKLKLSQIRLFRELFIDVTEPNAEIQHPFSILRRVFQRGYPLLMLLKIWNHHFPDDLAYYQNMSKSRMLAEIRVDKAAIHKALSTFSSVPAFKHIGSLTTLDINDPLDETTTFLKVRATFPSLPTSQINGPDVEQVFALIKQVLALKQEQFQPVYVDSWIDQKMGCDRDPSQVELIVEFGQRERCLIDQMQNIAVIEGRLLKLNVLTSDELSALFTPLRRMMRAELKFLLSVETDLLRPPPDQQWTEGLREWSLEAEVYGVLIGTEPRNKRLLRSRLVGRTPLSQNARRDAIFECIALLSLPSLCLRTKVDFVQVSTVLLFCPLWG